VTSSRITTGGRSAGAGAGELVLYENDGVRLDLAAGGDTHLLVLGGEPLSEPIVQHGPFVMNTCEDIRQAILDFEAGRFGAVPVD
jgi:redox-sensitive bicupin YhaK (pirin superfamily)